MLPLIVSTCTGVFVRFLVRIGTSYIVVAGMFCTAIINLSNFFITLGSDSIYLNLGTLAAFNLFVWNWSFIIYSLVSTMILMVTTISFVIHLYSCSYMKQDPHSIRFLTYLTLFTFFMLLFVSAGNLLQMFLVLEWIVVCSYLLINFLFSLIQANKSAIKAMLMNKIVYAGLLISFSILFFIVKNIDFAVIFSTNTLISYRYFWD